jgi:hypothetical protein
MKAIRNVLHSANVEICMECLLTTVFMGVMFYSVSTIL